MSITEPLIISDELLRLPPLSYDVRSTGLRLAILPPGPVDLKFSMGVNLIDVNLRTSSHEMAVNSDKMQNANIDANSLSFWPINSDVVIRGFNSLPGCILEVGLGRMTEWVQTAGLSKSPQNFLNYACDPVAADIGRAAIRYLVSTEVRQQAADELTVEALALALGARAVRRLALEFKGDLGDGTLGDIRLRRAIDWAEDHLADPSLSISDMANAAGISPSRFSVVFKAATSETPYGYILRRRTEIAKDIILGSALPLAQVAVAAGFSSQSHMTTVMRRATGKTPGEMRR